MHNQGREAYVPNYTVFRISLSWMPAAVVTGAARCHDSLVLVTACSCILSTSHHHLPATGHSGVMVAAQVFDPEFRKQFPSVERYFVTLARQPKFAAAVGSDVQLCSEPPKGGSRRPCSKTQPCA